MVVKKVWGGAKIHVTVEASSVRNISYKCPSPRGRPFGSTSSRPKAASGKCEVTSILLVEMPSRRPHSMEINKSHARRHHASKSYSHAGKVSAATRDFAFRVF